MMFELPDEEDYEMDEKTRGMAARQDIVTWHTPEEKLPPECDTVVITFSGPRRIHALGSGAYCENEGWLIDGMDETNSDKMTVEAWCDLEPYMMGGARSTAEIARWGGRDDE